MRELYHSSKIIITKHYTIYNVYNAYYVYAHIYVFVGVFCICMQVQNSVSACSYKQ